MANIHRNKVTVNNVYCPWEDIDPQDRVIHHEFNYLRENEPEKLEEILSSLSEKEMEELYFNHAIWARDEQLVDFSDPHVITQYLAGRGFGKSYSLGVTAKRAVGYYDVKHILILAQTSKDLSRTIVPAIQDKYSENDPMYSSYVGNRAIIEWGNGATANLMSSESGEDAPRGGNYELLLGDENHFYGNNEGIITQALLATRIGISKAYFYTTPKGGGLANEWIKRGKDPEDDYIRLIQGSTHANKHNLSKVFYDTVISQYKGTRLERVELYGELLLENDGALFTRERISKNYVSLQSLPDFVEVSIGVDIALTTNATNKRGRADDTGIVVAGIDKNGISYIIDDHTGQYTVEGWTTKILGLYDKWSRVTNCHISVESNAGGRDLISSAFDKARSGSSALVEYSFSSANKMARMMPYALLTDQNKIKFVEDDGILEYLIDELTGYDGTGKSPNRYDAMSQAMLVLRPHENHRTVVKELSM